LERRSYSVAAIFEENWGNSPAFNSATVGEENQIQPDTNPPVLLNSLADARSFTFVFDEQLNESQAQQTNLTVYPTRTEINRIVNQGVLKVFFTDSITTTTSFTIALGSVEDIFGNSSPEFNQTLSYVLVKEPNPDDIFITEFVYRSSNATPEFIELYNFSDENIALSTLEIADNREQIRLEVLSGYPDFIKPKSYIAITTDERLPSLNDSGSDAIIVRYQHETLDSIHYQFPLWKSTNAGQSLERKQLFSISSDPSNWGLHPQRNHSAGKINQTDTLLAPLSISFAGWLVKDTLTLITSRYISNPSFLQLRLNSQEIVPVSVLDNTLLIAEEQPLTPEQLQLELIYTEPGYEAVSTKEIAFQSITENINPLIISEILFDPLISERGSQSEFIEVFNPNPFSLILPDNFIQIETITSGAITTLEFETNGLPISIPALKYMLIYPDSVYELSQSRLGQYFSLSDTIVSYRTDRNSLSLSSSNSAIKLVNVSGKNMDSVHYTTNWHNPNVVDVRGRSLERVLLNGPSNDKTNWSTSGNPLGATPGNQNSNYIEPLEAPKNQIVIFPNPFSPDEDGFEDNTTITWNLDGSNYLIDATIYDRYGRKVRTLAQNVVAGKTGSLVWDGKRDDGTFNRIGIYILLFKATDTSVGEIFVKKESIVIARMM
jgi:hypothetical protein